MSYTCSSIYPTVTGLGSPNFTVLGNYLASITSIKPPVYSTPYPSSDFIDHNPCKGTATASGNCTAPPGTT